MIKTLISVTACPHIYSTTMFLVIAEGSFIFVTIRVRHSTRKTKWSVRQRLNTCMRPLYLPSLSMLLITTKITLESNPSCCSEVAESPLLVSAKCTLVARTSIRRRCENSINPDTVLKAPYQIHQVKYIIQCIYG